MNTGQADDSPTALDPQPGLAASTQALIIAAQEQERAAIAEQFYNGPAPTLVNLILEAEICERLMATDADRAQAGLRDLRASILRSLHTIRRFIFDVHPVALAELGLFGAIRRFVEDWNAEERRQVTLKIEGEERRLSAAKELALYRIVQEAIKMPEDDEVGRATTVQVAITPDLVRITLEAPTIVRPGSVRSGNELPRGYQHINERAITIGATVTVDARPGAQLILILVPLNDTDRAATAVPTALE